MLITIFYNNYPSNIGIIKIIKKIINKKVYNNNIYYIIITDTKVYKLHINKYITHFSLYHSFKKQRNIIRIQHIKSDRKFSNNRNSKTY